MVDRIVKVEMFKQILFKEVSILSGRFMGMEILFVWGLFHLPTFVKQKVHK